MSTNSNTRVSRAILTTVLLAFPVFASHHAELNGTWNLVPTKSNFAGEPVIQTGTVTISERQGNLTVERHFQYDGAKQTFFYRDITDGEDNATIHSAKHSPKDLITKTKWDHDVLKVTTIQSGATTVERYSLAPDGTMMVNVDRPDHKPVTLVFTRQ